MKRILTTVIALVICFTAVLPCNAAYAEETTQISSQSSDEIESKRAEQTQWYFRKRNGIVQRRLWSITYGYWKTDWIPA